MDVLLIEDDPLFAQLLEKLFRKHLPDHHLIHVEDGQHALELLLHSPQTASETIPHLIVLDLNLPAMGGLDVLRRLKSDDTVKAIPVIVLTALIDETSLVRSYANGANSFIRKPILPDEFIQAVHYWLKPPPA